MAAQEPSAAAEMSLDDWMGQIRQQKLKPTVTNAHRASSGSKAANDSANDSALQEIQERRKGLRNATLPRTASSSHKKPASAGDHNEAATAAPEVAKGSAPGESPESKTIDHGSPTELAPKSVVAEEQPSQGSAGNVALTVAESDALPVNRSATEPGATSEQGETSQAAAPLEDGPAEAFPLDLEAESKVDGDAPGIDALANEVAPSSGVTDPDAPDRVQLRPVPPRAERKADAQSTTAEREGKDTTAEDDEPVTTEGSSAVGF